MKYIDKKIDTLYDVINTSKPESFFKIKFQEFCTDLFFGNDGPYFEDEDYVFIWNKMYKSDLLKDNEYREMCVHAASFSLFIYYAYVDFCLKNAFLTRKSMKIFTNKVNENYFANNYPDFIFDYYKYLKRKGNENIEKESTLEVDKKFPFFKNMNEYRFSFNVQKEEDSEESIKEIENALKISYGSYITFLSISFSTLINYLNAFTDFEKIASAE
ncbi:MAG: hypothetical protein ACOCUI_00110 [bacterium]